MNDKLANLLAEKGALLADGATGTSLFEMRLEAGEAPELWNINEPQKIELLHQGFVDAGSDIILTNSFGGTRHRLKLHKADDRVFEINKRAAEIACKIAATVEREVIVAGSVGPTGELLVPLGTLTYDVAVASFKEQMEGLIAGGVDVLWIETMSSPEEINAAAEAANLVDMPYVVTASFDTAGRTMMGLAPEDFHSVITAVKIKPTALGANCGVGASDLLSSVLDMTKAAPEATIIAKANCGVPVIRGDKVEYTGSPELMSEYVKLALDAGAKIIGGCCGTSTEHLKAMRIALDEHLPTVKSRPDIGTIEATIGPMINKKAMSMDEMPKRERKGRRRAVR
ncbi:MAG: betaine--homocysteine S-methyltransferase [Rhizobiaceae bacterium]|nr:betaine--homocysteine S-methyltransferase [Rhizobiaceae bacterium]